MGVLDKLMFWKTDEPVIEPVEGFTVDGCFTLPEAELQGGEGATPAVDPPVEGH